MSARTKRQPAAAPRARVVVAKRRRTPAGRLVALAATLAAVGCLDNSVTGVRELSVSLTVEPAAPTVGQNVLFRYHATGTGLVAVIVDYGDGVADTTFYNGPLDVMSSVEHVYQAAGTFTVAGIAIGSGGEITETLDLTVN